MRSALKGVPGVIDADVALPDKALVKIEKNKVTPAQLIQAVKKAGYSAKERDPKKEKQS